MEGICYLFFSVSFLFLFFIVFSHDHGVVKCCIYLFCSPALLSPVLFRSSSTCLCFFSPPLFFDRLGPYCFKASLRFLIVIPFSFFYASVYSPIEHPIPHRNTALQERAGTSRPHCPRDRKFTFQHSHYSVSVLLSVLSGTVHRAHSLLCPYSYRIGDLQ